jgi:hypothetical protein
VILVVYEPFVTGGTSVGKSLVTSPLTPALTPPLTSSGDDCSDSSLSPKACKLALLAHELAGQYHEVVGVIAGLEELHGNLEFLQAARLDTVQERAGIKRSSSQNESIIILLGSPDIAADVLVDALLQGCEESALLLGDFSLSSSKHLLESQHRSCWSALNGCTWRGNDVEQPINDILPQNLQAVVEVTLAMRMSISSRQEDVKVSFIGERSLYSGPPSHPIFTIGLEFLNRRRLVTFLTMMSGSTLRRLL